MRLAGQSGRYRVSRRCQAYYCATVNLRQARWMSRTLFPIAASSFDVLTLNMRRCVSRSNVKCSASAEAAVLQDSSSFSANFFWCVRFGLVIVQLLLAIEVHSAHVTKRTLLHGSPSTSSVVKRSRESYLQTSCKHSPKK